MDNLGFPQKTRSHSKGDEGEAFFDYFIHSKLNWSYRPIHRESDYGIDGFVDVICNQVVTGKSLAVQIKCGDSYISKKTTAGIKYYGEMKHINFYLNNNLPIVLVVLSGDCSIGYWVEFDIEMTSREGGYWWIEIPFRNKLDSNVKQKWESISGLVTDYSEAVNKLWNTDTLLEDTVLRVYSIPKEEILNCSIDYIKGIIKRLSKTKDHALKNRGKLEIFFPEYDDDEREIYMIPEIRKWITLTIQNGIPWFYFLDTDILGAGLKNIYNAYNTIKEMIKVNGGYIVRVSGEKVEEFLKRNFDNINVFTIENDITEEINKERCDAAISVLFPKKSI